MLWGPEIEGLTIVNLSVCPILTNNHMQVNAYVITKKIIAENRA
jgi:hypothetical protein